MGKEGAILAGGLGRRMGGVSKGLLPYGGSTLLQTIADRMASRCERVSVIVATEEQANELASVGHPIRLDYLPGTGPLSGLHTALSCALESMVWVSACDMPGASAEAASWMEARLEQSGANAIVPSVGGRLHPLQAVYRAECSVYTLDCVSSGIRRMMELLERVKPLVVDESELSRAGFDLGFVRNINTPEDYGRLELR